MTGQHIVIGIHGGMVQWARGSAPDVDVTILDFDDYNDYGGTIGIYNEGQGPLEKLPEELEDCLDDEGLVKFLNGLGFPVEQRKGEE